MPKEIIHTDKLATPTGIMSQGVKVPAGHIVFASGQTARDATGAIVGVGDIKAQTRQTLENVKAVLEAAGATLEDIVKVQVFITRVADYADIHAVRSEYFKSDYPASTMVEVTALVHPDMLIEIDAIAVIP